MAGKIKGITVEIGGDTTGLDRAISKVNGNVKNTQKELNEVNKLLKFNPGNADLIAQKQEVLAKQIQNTSEKLKTLKEVQSQVDDQFKNGKINDEQYRKFNRQVIDTEQSLNNLKSELASVGSAQKELESKTKQLDTLFKATGTNVDQYADSLGTGLVNAIKSGKASAAQLDVALAKIGKEALGSSADIDKMKQALKSVDDGASIKAVKKDLSDVAKEAKNAGEEVNGFGDKLKNVVAGLAAGAGIGAVVSKSLDTSSLKTKIDITFDVPEKSKESIREAVRGIEAYGVDGEAALQGVQRQWALNKKASDEANSAIIQKAGVIASAYAGIDFNELIQESFEMSKSMGISQQKALGLTNYLLKIGFPAEQLDIISEYGTQLKNAGYNAQEIQSIMAAGVETGTWNIDNLLDGLKEGRIRMAEFGQGVPKATKALLDGTNISAKQLQIWGNDVAAGGKKGSQAMTDVAKALVGVKDETTRNALGVAIFGTMYEDQGKNITDTLLNASQKTSDLKKNQDDLNNSVKQYDANPMVKMKQAFADMQTALTPLLTGIAELVAKIANWISQNSTLAAVIASVVTAIGLIAAGFMILIPMITSVTGILGTLGISIGAIVAPIGIAIAAIVALVAAGVALWKNWDSVKNVASNTWNSLLGIIAPALSAVTSFIQSIGAQIVQFWSTNGNNIKTIASTVWSAISSVVSTAMSIISTVMQAIWPVIKSLIVSTWDAIKNVIQGAISVITGIIQVFSSVLTGNWKQAWEGVKQVLTGALQLIWGAINLYFVGKLLGPLKAFGPAAKSLMTSVWNGIKTIVTGVLNALKGSITSSFNLYKTSISTILNVIKSIVSSVWNGIKTVITTVMGGLKNTISSAWNGIKSLTSSAINGIKNTISNIFNSFKNVVSTAMSSVKTAIQTGWNNAKSFLQGISLTTIGKNIIQGLVNGIGSMMGSVTTKVKEIANSIPAGVKKLLGIHSPSRVMASVGYWISEGLAKGIKANTNAEKAAKAKAQAIVSTYKNKLKELDTKYKSGMIDTKSYVKSLKNLKSAYGSISGATTDIQSRISKANTKQALAEQKKRQEAQRKLTQKFNNEMTNLSNKYNAGILTDKQYITKLQGMKKEYSKVTNAISKIDLKIANVKKAQIKDQFKDDKAAYDAKKKDAKASLQDELNTLNELSKHYKKNSDERIYFENLAKQKKQEITEAKKKIDEDYLSKVEEVNSKLAESEQKLTDEYKKAVDDRAKSLYSFAGLFDEVTLNSEVSGEQLLSNLQGQVTTFEQWQQSLANLKARGVSDGLISELQQMGPKSAAEVAALNTLTDEQLTQYQGLWQTKSKLAHDEAVSELEGMRIDTATQITKLREDAQTQLETYRTEWETKMKSVVGSAKNMSKQMPSIGANAVQGLINGINSKKTELQAVAAELAAIVAGTTQSELDIHSPSRVMKKLGVYTNEGFIVGLQDSAARLKNAMSNLYGSLANSAQTMMTGSSTVNSSSSSYDYSKHFQPKVEIYTQESPERVVQRTLDRMAYKF